MSGKLEFQPCGKANGDMKEQRWVGMVNWHGQRYRKWLCYCTGKAHVNKVLHLTASSINRVPEHKISGGATGKSIFGQTLPRKGS